MLSPPINTLENDIRIVEYLMESGRVENARYLWNAWEDEILASIDDLASKVENYESLELIIEDFRMRARDITNRLDTGL